MASRKRRIAPGPDETRREVPEHVAIAGLGPTCAEYLNAVKMAGGIRAFSDELWGINALGGIFQCDLVFHMDDVKVQEVRAAAKPEGNIAAMLKWMKTYEGPIMTSRAYPDYPSLIEFPLEAALNAFRHGYFNGTAAYAIVYAMLIGVKRVSFFGCDYSYSHSHSAEKGRGCLEYWIGQAMARGMKIAVAQKSSLLDACEPPERHFYGYDAVAVDAQPQEDGTLKVSFTPKSLPTAEEMEERYNHSRPTTPEHLL